MKNNIFTAFAFAVIIAALLCGCSKNKDDRGDQQSGASQEISVQNSSGTEEESIMSSRQNSNELSKTENSSDEKSSNESSEEENSINFVDFSGESRDYTLQDFYKSPEAKVMINSAKEQYKSDQYDIDVKLKDEKTVIVTATLKDSDTAEKFDDEKIEAYFSSAQSQADSYIKMLETFTITDDIQIEAVILSPDGSEIARRTFTASPSDDEEDDDYVGPTLSQIFETGVVQKSLDNIAESFGEEGAQVSAAVENDNVLVITVQLQQCVPEEGVPVIKERLGTSHETLSAVTEELRMLTNDDSVTVTIRVIDACSKIVAGVTSDS